MNKAHQSKINYTALIVQILTLLVVFDVLPEEAQEPILIIVGLVAPTVIQIFRTWFHGGDDA